MDQTKPGQTRDAGTGDGWVVGAIPPPPYRVESYGATLTQLQTVNVVH